MKKEEFIRQLEYLLQDIQEDDKRDAIDYYSDYLEEAGPEREAEVLEGFGSPERIASMIRTELLGGMEGAGEFTDNGYDDHRFNTSSYPAVKGREQQEHSRDGESRSGGEYRRDREYRGNGYGEQKEPVIPAAGEIMKREVTMKREVMPIRARALIRMTESGGSTC